MSRDQFSQLMLVYTGMAADIVEIFEAFRESKVMIKPHLTYAVLAVWNWSLLQFSLAIGASHKSRKTTGPVNYNRQTSSGSAISRDSRGSRLADADKKLIDADIIAIVITIVLQDIPFICLRLTLIFGYGVISHMNIFFTCKNSLVILLQLYRLLVLVVKKRPQYRRHSIFSMLPAEDKEDEEDSEIEIKTNTGHIDDDISDEEYNNPKGNKFTSYHPSRRLPKNTTLALQPSTTSTDDLPLSTSGGSTASSMTDIENFGKFSNLKGTPTIERKMSYLNIREGRNEVKKIDQRRKFHKQKVCAQISNNDLNGRRPIKKIIQQTLI
eukprot:TRINITY_DN23427_c0_g1_i1.p1 TRINITY_DN23427_c0_g1~~TRINITY_DN23427_c0_g1_i1.p1  ORF type:complete len:380 (-),score=85.77 TRINITY_DN23427_c0_g1_i1:30-1004(-)